MIAPENSEYLCSDEILTAIIYNNQNGNPSIAKPLSEVQDKNKDVEIGSYPFFKAGKLGVSIVLRSEDQSKIDDCNSQILKFLSKKNIKQINKD